eukprot:PhM_4_TR10521/c0_g1_i1/m.56298
MMRMVTDVVEETGGFDTPTVGLTPRTGNNDNDGAGPRGHHHRANDGAKGVITRRRSVVIPHAMDAHDIDSDIQEDSICQEGTVSSQQSSSLNNTTNTRQHTTTNSRHSTVPEEPGLATHHRRSHSNVEEDPHPPDEPKRSSVVAVEDDDENATASSGRARARRTSQDSVGGTTVTLVRMLAYGAFGQVYYGRRGDNNEPVAVKRILACSDDMQQRQLQQQQQPAPREATTMSRTHHNNIVEFYGQRSDLATGEMYIFMEYLPGGSVASMLQHFGSLPERLVRVLARHVLTGLAHLHGGRIVHRDIKGANVLLGYDASRKFPVVAKIADFGCSRMIMGMTVQNQFASLQGTPHWMAPEVIKQTGHSRPADIWSVACTMVEMLTGGKPPFADIRQPHAAMLAIANYSDPTTLQLPSTLSDECVRVLRLCLSPNPEERPSTGMLLSGEVGFFLEDPEEELRELFDDPNCTRLLELIVDYVRERTEVTTPPDSEPQVLHNVRLTRKPTPPPPSVRQTRPPLGTRTPAQKTRGSGTAAGSATNILRPLCRATALTPSKTILQLRKPKPQVVLTPSSGGKPTSAGRQVGAPVTGTTPSAKSGGVASPSPKVHPRVSIHGSTPTRRRTPNSGGNGGGGGATSRRAFLGQLQR